MILLTATTMTLQVVLDAAPTTTQATLYAAWADHTSVAFTPGQTNGLSNGTTAVDIVGAPGASTQRQVKYLSIYNSDTASMTVTVRLNDNTTLRTLERVTLLTGERIEFVDGVGFRVLTSDGSVRTPNTLPYSVTQLKNVLLNGNFDLWQRGTTSGAVAVGAAYLADRWARSALISQMNSSRQAFTVGQTDVPGNPTYFHRVQVVSVANAGAAANMTQPIEDVRTFAGQMCTLSFWAKADAPKPISFELYQNFGTGGGASSIVFVAPVKVNLTTSWQKFTATFSVPSILGKTLGTDNNHSLQVGFWFDAGSTFNSRTNSLGQQSGTFDLAQIQLEAGSLATGFDRRLLSVELLLCQRYYQKSYNTDTVPGTVSSEGRAHYFVTGLSSTTRSSGIYVSFATNMRGVPALTLYSDATGASGNLRNVSAAADVAAATTSIGQSGFLGFNSVPFAAGTEVNMAFHWAADAEL
jgi:hypothetical protein